MLIVLIKVANSVHLWPAGAAQLAVANAMHPRAQLLDTGVGPVRHLDRRTSVEVADKQVEPIVPLHRDITNMSHHQPCAGLVRLAASNVSQDAVQWDTSLRTCSSKSVQNSSGDLPPFRKAVGSAPRLSASGTASKRGCGVPDRGV